MVQLLHSCGPLFKIIRVCGPQPAKNTYFGPKIRVFSKKKKGLQLESIYEVPFSSQNHSVLQKKKVAAACTKLFRGPQLDHAGIDKGTYYKENCCEIKGISQNFTNIKDTDCNDQRTHSSFIYSVDIGL